jgi:DNA-binding MarR family transcriptional regulator
MTEEISFDEEDYQDVARFRTALHGFLGRADRRAREVGLTPQQYLLLLVLRGHRQYPRVSITELAEALQLRRPSVSLLVDRSVKRGYLDRRQDPLDRRRTVITLTAKGQGLLDSVMEANLIHPESGLFADQIVKRVRQRQAAERGAAGDGS